MSWMVECRRGAGLSLKTIQGFRVPRHLLGQELDGHVASEPDILGFVDDAHAANAQLGENAVVRERLPDDWQGHDAPCRRTTSVGDQDCVSIR
jgi:hypothetical protein